MVDRKLDAHAPFLCGDCDGFFDPECLSADFENFCFRTQRHQSLKRGLDDVGWIAGAEGFRQHIADARRFDHGADTAAGNDAGSR